MALLYRGLFVLMFWMQVSVYNSSVPSVVGVEIIVWQAGVSRHQGLILQQFAHLQLSNL